MRAESSSKRQVRSGVHAGVLAGGLFTLALLASVALLAQAATAQCPGPPVRGSGIQLVTDACPDSTSGVGTDILRLGAWEKGQDVVVSMSLAVPYHQPSAPTAAQIPVDTLYRTQFGIWDVGGPQGGTCYGTFIEYQGGSGLGTNNVVVSNQGCQLINTGATNPTPITGSFASFPMMTAGNANRYCNELDTYIPKAAIGNPAAGTLIQWGVPLGTEVFVAGSTQENTSPPGANFDTTGTATGQYAIGQPFNLLQGVPLVTATGTLTGIDVSWVPQDNLAQPTYEWRIYRAPVGSLMPPAPIAAVAGSILSYSDTAVVTGTEYTYWVTAVNCRGESPAGSSDGEVAVEVTASFVADSATYSTCLDSRVIFTDYSYGPDPDAISWLWDFGDGFTSTEQDPQHVFAAPGVYQVTLTASDNDGQSQVTQEVTSIGDPNCCPVLNALDNLRVNAGTPASFVVQATDPDGSPIVYGYEGFFAGTKPEMNAQTGAFHWETPLEGGRYLVQPTASDGECTVMADVAILVIPEQGLPDGDLDGIPDFSDNCPHMANNDQADNDRDGQGDICDEAPCGAGSAASCIPAGNRYAPLSSRTVNDTDRDGIPDVRDNCIAAANNDQKDMDSDGIGDLCDEDVDGDSALDAKDNCPTVSNPDQRDTDLDGTGDACSIEGAGGLHVPSISQGSVADEPTGRFDSLMPRMGMAALAFVVVGFLGMLVVRRLKAT